MCRGAVLQTVVVTAAYLTSCCHSLASSAATETDSSAAASMFVIPTRTLTGLNATRPPKEVHSPAVAVSAHPGSSLFWNLSSVGPVEGATWQASQTLYAASAQTDRFINNKSRKRKKKQTG